jgi:SAM-dependent methyltransferase
MTTIYVKDDTIQKDRREHDFYPTEPDLIRQALRFLDLSDTYSILDIGAGDGRWGREAKRLTEGQAQLYGIDIVGDKPNGFDFWMREDFLQYEYSGWMFDLIVSNPPYYIAEKIIRKAWTELAPGGQMVMLLRLSFQAGVDREQGLWQEIHPYQVGVVSRRPSFYDRGTNGTDYGVYYWKKDWKGDCWGVKGEWKTFLLLHDREPMKRKP